MFSGNPWRCIFTGFSAWAGGGWKIFHRLLQISGCFLVVKRFKRISDSSKIQTKTFDSDLKVGVRLLVYFWFSSNFVRVTVGASGKLIKVCRIKKTLKVQTIV